MFENLDKIFENDETNQIGEFSNEYEDLMFELVPVENKLRKYDTLIGSYKSEFGDLSATVDFHENENGSWTLTVQGFNVGSSKSLNVTEEYDEFENMVKDLKKYLNIDEDDDFDVWICGVMYTLKVTDLEMDFDYE